MSPKAKKLATRLASGGRFTVRITKRDATARQTLARLFADRKTRWITFIKKNGVLREMIFQYQGGTIQGSHMTVWDLEAQGVRKIDLNTVQGFGVVLKETKRTYEEIKAELHDLLF